MYDDIDDSIKIAVILINITAILYFLLNLYLDIIEIINRCIMKYIYKYFKSILTLTQG